MSEYDEMIENIKKEFERAEINRYFVIAKGDKVSMMLPHDMSSGEAFGILMEHITEMSIKGKLEEIKQAIERKGDKE